MVESIIRNPALAEAGRRNLKFAEHQMPVLMAVRERFAREKPLSGVRIALCLHVTKETGVLARTLVAGGAEIAVCASNPLSTQDDTAAALAAEGIPTFAVKGMDSEKYYACLNAALDLRPNITMDDGCDLISTIHGKRTDLLKDVWAGQEETTTGVIRLRAMEKDGALKFPVVAVNDTPTKHLFDNYYGTGQSTLDGIMRATNLFLAGSNFVVVGYGNCGKGVARRAQGMGAKVIVCEVDPVEAMRAHLDGFAVMPAAEAAKRGDIFVTVTGNKHVLRGEHFAAMRDGAVMCNTGHFNVEIDIPALESMAKGSKRVREFMDEYAMADGRSLFLLGEGRLINLAAAEGHPSAVMDMSFSNQALVSEYLAKHHKALSPKVIDVPSEIDWHVASIKLASHGVHIDKLTPEQVKYQASWREGT